MAAERAKEHKAIFAKARRHVSKLIRSIEQYLERGSTRQARETLRTYLGSFAAKLLAFERANRSMKRSRRLSTDQLVQMAEHLNPFAAEAETVQLWLKKKADGSYRAIHKYNIRHRARQQLVVAGLRPFIELRDNQFAQEARGRNAAINEVVRRIEAGARWFIERDVVNCYGTFASWDANIVTVLSEWLPLPQQVVRHCITAVEYSFEGHVSNDVCYDISLRVDSRRGLPQGSISSGLLAEARMAEALKVAAASSALRDVGVVAYSDNLGLLASRREDLTRSMATLERSIERCSSGSWRLNPRPVPRRVDHGFDFLGYRVRLKGSRVHVTVSQDNRDGFVERARELLKDARRRSSCDLSTIRDYIMGWTSAFREDRSVRENALLDLVTAGWDLCPHLVPQLRCIFESTRASRRTNQTMVPTVRIRPRTRPQVHSQMRRTAKPMKDNN